MQEVRGMAAERLESWSNDRNLVSGRGSESMWNDNIAPLQEPMFSQGIKGSFLWDLLVFDIILKLF